MQEKKPEVIRVDIEQNSLVFLPKSDPGSENGTVFGEEVGLFSTFFVRKKLPKTKIIFVF